LDLRFDHLGVVAKSLKQGRKMMQQALLVKDWTEVYEDTLNGVVLQFGFDQSGMCYELLEPIDQNSPVFPALSGRKAILNHVAYRVQNLAASASHLVAAGCAPTSKPKPAVAYEGRKIQFFVTPLWFVVELIEAWEHRHLTSILPEAAGPAARG